MGHDDLSPISREAMRLPAALRVLVGSLIVALLLNLLPWHGALLLIRPDFVLVMLLYWAVYEPRLIGQGVGFFMALLMDVADSALLGQHALAYVVAIFLAEVLRVRIQQLNWAEQALHIGGILLIAQSMTLTLNLMLGRDMPGWLLLFGPLFSALLWPLLHLVTGWQKLRMQPPTTIMR